MQLLHRMFGSPRQSFIAFLFPIGLTLLVMATMHSCGRSGDFHKTVDEQKEAPEEKAQKSGNTEEEGGEDDDEEAGKLVHLLELFPR